jgi:UDP-2-acetamido-2-deoxy-ribo-hexuluronate aminotransferase
MLNEPIPFIDLKEQYLAIKDLVNLRINKVLDHGNFILGPEVAELENTLAEFVGSKFCISVASGTEALLISLMAAGIKSGDEVITTPFSFIAAAEMIVLLGAKPIFVDIEEDTCNINSSLIEKAITPKTRAIIPVSLYGQPSDMDEINDIAKKYNLIVIEDAAQSFGATYKKKQSCNLSDIGCTSFFPSKPLGCYGDGGAIFTNNPSLALACRSIRVHGQTQRYTHTRLGVGGRMDTIQCAILLAKFNRFKEEIKKRQKIALRYNEAMDELGINRIYQKHDRNSVFAQYTIILNDRESTQKVLDSKKIPYAVHYPTPINEQEFYKTFCCDGCTPIAKTISGKVLSLPMGPDLKPEHQDFIVSVLKLINE